MRQQPTASVPDLHQVALGRYSQPCQRHHTTPRSACLPANHLLLFPQLSRKRLLEDEYRQAVSTDRNFWWKWLHGQERSKAQQQAAAAAISRAEAAQLPEQNRFEVLADQVRCVLCVVNQSRCA